MSVEECYLKIALLSRYALSFVSNPSDEKSRFVIDIAIFLKEECSTNMLHGDMNLSRLWVYAQSIYESKRNRI